MTGQVKQLRLVVHAEDFDAVRFFRDVVGMPEEESYSGGRAVVTILGAGRATLELANTAQVEMIDQVEVGRRVAPHFRVALEVEDTAAQTRAVVDAGATSSPSRRDAVALAQCPLRRAGRGAPDASSRSWSRSRSCPRVGCVGWSRPGGAACRGPRPGLGVLRGPARGRAARDLRPRVSSSSTSTGCGSSSTRCSELARLPQGRRHRGDAVAAPRARRRGRRRAASSSRTRTPARTPGTDEWMAFVRSEGNTVGLVEHRPAPELAGVRRLSISHRAVRVAGETSTTDVPSLSHHEYGRTRR